MPLLSGELVLVMVSSIPVDGVEPASLATEMRSARVVTPAPLQSVTRTLTGIVSPCLKMLGSFWA